MKRLKVILIFAMLIGLSAIVSAEGCELDTTLINQDPYPAIPGDYVKVVFQLSGVADPACGKVNFKLEEEYPFSLDKGTSNQISFDSGTFVNSYKNTKLIAFKLRIDENAIDGENPLSVSYSGSSAGNVKEFNITIEDKRLDFEVHVKDYVFETKEITIEFLNIGENDAQAVTIEIPTQENILMVGANRKIVGDIDSNEEDSATFKVELINNKIDLIILYTDGVGVRRIIEKQINFNTDDFERKKANGESKISPTLIFFIGFFIPILSIIAWKYYEKRKERKHSQHQRR